MSHNPKPPCCSEPHFSGNQQPDPLLQPNCESDNNLTSELSSTTNTNTHELPTNHTLNQMPYINSALSVFYTNADSLSNKLVELKAIIDLKNPDIICITETKPKNYSLPPTPHDLDNLGYNSYHNTNGRGVSIYIKNSIPSEELQIEPNFCVSMWVKLSLKNTTVLIGGVYRSPNSTPENTTLLNEIITNAVNCKASITVIMGDFNFKEIHWDTNILECGLDHPASRIHDLINDLYLTQLITEPTRFRIGESQNILDWVIVDQPHRIQDLHCGPPLGEKGDHCTITFKMIVTYDRNNKGGYLQFGKTNFEEFRNILTQIDWNILNNMDVEQAWSYFIGIMTTNINRFVPRSKPRLHKSPPWSNSTTKSVIREKNRAWSQYKKRKTDQNWAQFTTIRNKCNREIILQKKNFEKKIASNIKNNPKIFWNYVKYATGGQKEIPALHNEQGNSVTDNLKKAELFNQYFCDVYTTEDTVNFPTLPHYQINNPLTQCSLTFEKVKQEIEKLNISKAAGPDQLHPKIIHTLRDTLTEPIYIIFNKSLTEGKLPIQWKEAYIKPIFKKGSKHQTSNYRPVSLTAVCCKILERIIRKDIMSHLEGNKLITEHQHGFRSGMSCCTQLLELMEIWTNLIEKGESWDCIYLDFAKAFDKVPHQRLLQKIFAMGIRGNLHKWLSDFLHNRQQLVVIKDSKSSHLKVTSGIPQGSVLGPILFIMYINDLPNAINSYVKIFADDTKLFNSVISIDQKDQIQEDLEALHSWSVKWQLKFNESKCKVVHYGPNNPNHQYILNNTTLESCNIEKDLGVTFDNNLKFTTHVNNITAKANSRLAIIRQTMHDITPEIFLPLYKALVRPLLEYCTVVWNPLLKGDKVKIEQVQRRATKLVKSLSHLDYNERLIRLKLDSLNFRRRRADMIQVFRIIKGIDKIDHSLFFTLNPNSRTRGHSLKIFKPQTSNRIRANYFSQRVINDWNLLSEDVVNCPTLNSFKTALKKFWLNHPEKYDMP